MSMTFPGGGAYGGPREIAYLFIDAGCLREVLRGIAERYIGVREEKAISVDWAALLAGSAHTKAFYYDAVPSRETGEADDDWQHRIEPRMAELRAIRAVKGYHVPLGDLRGKKARQKKVDVMIAVDVLMHTVRRNMHRCTLLAGDVDFQPLIEALVREGMDVALWHPRQASDDLTGSADAAEPIEPRLLNHLRAADGSALLSQVVRKARPREAVAHMCEWHVGDDDARIYALPEGWLVERFNPSAYGVTTQLHGTSLRATLTSAVDLIDLPVPPMAWELADRLGLS